MRRSLRQRLFFILAGSVVCAWLATALFSYFDTKKQIDEMLDASLVQAAELILVLMAELETGEVRAKTVFELPTNHAQMIAYRVWAADKHLLVASPNMPRITTDSWQKGFSNKVIENENWRFYGIENHHGVHVEVGQRYDFRSTFAKNVATHLFHPVWFAIPLLAILIWLSVSWGVAPLKVVTKNVIKRSADDLAPLNTRNVPSEIMPLIEALNGLFSKIGKLLEKERRFTADASHELRTPLAAIRTHTQVAQHARNEKERTDALDRIKEGTDRAVRLIEQLLVLARLDHQNIFGAQEKVNLSDVVIQAVLSENTHSLEKNIDLGFSKRTDEEALVVGNADLLMILVRNILNNAICYTPEGGTVDVSIEKSDECINLRILDTGPGIPEERRKRVFDRFYRIEGSGENGCGLGLSIVLRIAEMHGASVHLTDNPTGQGLCLIVAFPS